MSMDIRAFFEQFWDHLAPKLDPHEQVLYLYILRRTRWDDEPEATIGFKTAGKAVALGTRFGAPISEGTMYAKLKSLAKKGCIKIIRTEHNGTRIALYLPHEIPGLIPSAGSATPAALETLDFFSVPENRLLLLQREDHRCFYCLSHLDASTFVAEHVVSRPNGDNSYLNVVAGCRRCNNRKGDTAADDFLRVLYREGLLNEKELEGRLSAVTRLRGGHLRPPTRPS